jgi:hypothetical protein
VRVAVATDGVCTAVTTGSSGSVPGAMITLAVPDVQAVARTLTFVTPGSDPEYMTTALLASAPVAVTGNPSLSR